VDHLTPNQVARAIGVSEASLKRWCDKGTLPSIRTAGGHRRIPLSGVMQFLRENGHPLVRPEVLGLPPNTGAGRTVAARSVEQVSDALAAGDEQQFQRIIFDLHLAGHALRAICDRTLAPALCELGTRWEHGRIEIYQERRACEICLRALHRFTAVLPPPPDDAPLAIGGTPNGDPYTLPTLMAELTLREVGWRAESLGSNLPGSTLRAAVRDLKPRLIWLSVSCVADADAFVQDYEETYQTASLGGAAIVVGGKALREETRSRMRYSAFCDTLNHLAAFVQSLVPTAVTRAS
jgi:excisionase family DNA binding protein